MAGYSGTPLRKKLGIKEGHRVALIGAAAGFERLQLGSIRARMRPAAGLWIWPRRRRRCRLT